jgi:acetyl esterase/lipase
MLALTMPGLWPRRLGAVTRELVAGAVTPPILAAVVAATIAGSTDPEGTVLRYVPRRIQEAMRESRIAWTQYSNFEYFAAGLAVAAIAPRKARTLLKEQRAGPDFSDVSCLMGAGVGLGQSAATCDVYLPTGASAAGRFDELLVFVPGGAWSHGFKRFYTLTSRRLANECASASIV